jgi:predicted transcriptional regulator
MFDDLTPSALKDVRKKAGISTLQLAERSGVHQTTITRIERGDVDPRLSQTWTPIVQALRELAAAA